MSAPFFNPTLGSKERPRIQKACDKCRKRKTRCDGKLPCKNCSSVEECTFSPHRGRRLRSQMNQIVPMKPREPATSYEKLLLSRVESLEQLIKKLSSNIDTLADPQPFVEWQSPESGSESSKSISSRNWTPSLTRALPAPNKQVLSQMDPNLLLNAANDPQVSEVPCAIEEATGYALVRHFKKYSGYLTRKMRPDLVSSPLDNKCHSLFGYLSDLTKDWIKRRLQFRDMGLFWSMERLPSLFLAPLLTLVRLWLEGPGKIISNPLANFQNNGKFPQDKAMVFGLLKSFYSRIFFANFICNTEYIIQLFEIYYDATTSNTILRLSNSELLIMNSALALALENKSNEWSKATEMYYPAELRKLQEQWFHNAIIHYNKIQIEADGISTVQGILLLNTLVNSRYTTDFSVNAMLMSSAVRHALDLGINRVDLVASVPPGEADLSRRVWWYCQIQDIDASYKTGKPPYIHHLDVSTLTEIDVDCPYSVGDDLHYNFDYVTRKSMDGGPHIYYCYAMLALTRIKYRSYYLLFSAKAQATIGRLLDKTNQALRTINKMMYDFAAGLDPLVRPDHLDSTMYQLLTMPRTPESQTDPTFHDLFIDHQDFLYEMKMTIQGAFYSHLMFVNRIPFAVYFPEQDLKEEFSILSYEASRAILRTLIDMDHNKLNKFTNMSLVNAGFLGMISLVFKHVTAHDSIGIQKDFDILSKVSMDVFSADYEYYTREDWKRERESEPRMVLVILVSRVILRIILGVVESETGVNLAAGNDRLQKHLDGCEDIYHEIFENANRDAIPDFFFMNLNIPNSWESPKSKSTERNLEEVEEVEIENPLDLQDFNEDAISNLFYSQAYNLSGSVFQEAYKSH